MAASCGPGEVDDSNLMFTDLLGRMTTAQARLFEHICRLGEKRLSHGLLQSIVWYMRLADLQRVMQIDDVHRIDRELDYLREIGVLHHEGGFHDSLHLASVAASSLALHMYAKCRGFSGDPIKFYGLEYPPAAEPPATTDA